MYWDASTAPYHNLTVPLYSNKNYPGLDAGYHYISEGMPCFIGRGASSLIQINSPYLSYRHCELFKRRGIWYIQDLNSRNGTWVDGEWLSPGDPKPLETLSRIQLSQGKFKCRFVWTSDLNGTIPTEIFQDGWPEVIKFPKEPEIPALIAPDKAPWPVKLCIELWNYAMDLPLIWRILLLIASALIAVVVML